MTLFRFAALGAAAVITVLFPVTATISTVRVLRVRRRQRELLALVGYADAAAPGAVVIPHARPMAYCVPGFRPRIVLSAGALATLDRAQLAAVLGHERAHASERHDLVLVPFTALRRLLPHSHWVARMSRIVALLLEMRADDRACRTSTPSSLHAALRQFQIAGGSAPAGALGFGGGDDGGDDIAARLHRLADPRPPLHIRWAALSATMVLAATPVSLFLWP